MRKLCILGLLCFLTACDWFASKEAKTQKMVEEEMQNINWNEVDQYPLFSDCDELASKGDQKNCFEATLLMHFSMTLQEFDFVLDTNVNDTVYVDFMMDQDGLISVLDIEKDDAIETEMPEFDGVITQSLKSLPRVAPALKRGIPVSAKFRIPIVLNTE
ncbi:hypothetical protein WIW50_03035 [Flavobacteriaceae bacterium 3-367]|uniref:hypothetical protein n=1 Tax=Eudoraea algarum TaxID=3417568 RepID=UPI0032856580